MSKDDIKKFLMTSLQGNDDIKTYAEYEESFKPIFLELLKYYKHFDKQYITFINNVINETNNDDFEVTKIYERHELSKVYRIKSKNKSYIVKMFYSKNYHAHKEIVISSYLSCLRDPVFIFFPDVYFINKIVNDQNEEIYYMVSEDINSLENKVTSLYKFIVDSIFEEQFKLKIKKIFFQLFHALSLVNTSLNGLFMHYDLHPENIFVIENDQNLVLNINNQKYNLSGIRIAIIDFGTSIAISNCYDDCEKYDVTKPVKKSRNNARRYGNMIRDLHQKIYNIKKVRARSSKYDGQTMITNPPKDQLKIKSSDLRYLYYVLKNLCFKKLLENGKDCSLLFDTVDTMHPYKTYLTHPFFDRLKIK